MKLNHSLFALTFLLVLNACGREALDDYNDVSFSLLNQNGEEVLFPDDLKGSPVAMGFIYTNCPDICSFITANLYKIWTEMDQPDDVHFVLVTFDPERDTPEVLKSYASSFNMDQLPFSFLTGSEEEVGAMMERVGIQSQVSYTHETDEGEDLYFLNHTDRILVIDDESRLVVEYGGSMTPTRIIVEDLEQML